MNDDSDKDQSQRGDSQNSDFFFNRDNNSERDSVDTNELLKEINDEEDEQENEIQLINADDNNKNRSLESAEIENIRDSLSTIQDEDEEEQEHEQEAEKSSSATPTATASPSGGGALVAQYDTAANDDNLDHLIDLSDIRHVLEPKLREAYIQMKRLDLKLQEALRLEKQTKRETQALIERNRASLELLRLASDHKETAQEAKNTAQFLQLGYATTSLHEEQEDDDDTRSGTTDREFTPLFKTQLDEDEKVSERDKKQQQKHPSATASKTSSMGSNNNKTSSNNSSSNKTSKSQAEKDFIKRNIKLAQDAGEVIAMTDEEKQRLNELLLSLDDDDDNNEAAVPASSAAAPIEDIVEYNPYAVSLPHGEGFTPERVEMERLREIDARIERSAASLTITSRRNSFMSMQSNANTTAAEVMMTEQPRQVNLNEEHFDENEFGDKFIREARLNREQEQRLRVIDAQLETLKRRTSELVEDQDDADDDDDANSSFSKAASTPSVALIDEHTLKQLLEECVMSLKGGDGGGSTSSNKKLGVLLEESGAGGDASDIVSIGGASEVSLSEATLRSLLKQAKQEGITSRQEERGDSPEPPRVFYDEALEIIRNRSAAVLPQNGSSIDIEIEDVNSSIERSSLNKRQPLLESRISMNRLEQQQQSSRPTSSSSSTASSGSFLPKINSRFLPQK